MPRESSGGFRRKVLYEVGSSTPFRISRSKIDLFIECPRCFYLDQRLGVERPRSYPLTLNNAVDELLKKEFDIHRVKKSAHPLMKAYGIPAVPFSHPDLLRWRDSLRAGIEFLHTPTNLHVRGGIDDVWVSEKQPEELYVVDYKATSKKTPVTLDGKWQQSYKRQVEVYQWLFRHNGFHVSDTAYFVYVNGRTDKKAFDGKLEFDVSIISYAGDDRWVEGTLSDIKRCLDSEVAPEKSEACEYCPYRESAGKILLKLSGFSVGRVSPKMAGGRDQRPLF